MKYKVAVYEIEKQWIDKEKKEIAKISLELAVDYVYQVKRCQQLINRSNKKKEI